MSRRVPGVSTMIMIVMILSLGPGLTGSRASHSDHLCVHTTADRILGQDNFILPREKTSSYRRVAGDVWVPSVGLETIHVVSGWRGQLFWRWCCRSCHFSPGSRSMRLEFSTSHRHDDRSSALSRGWEQAPSFSARVIRGGANRLAARIVFVCVSVH